MFRHYKNPLTVVLHKTRGKFPLIKKYKKLKVRVGILKDVENEREIIQYIGYTEEM